MLPGNGWLIGSGNFCTELRQQTARFTDIPVFLRFILDFFFFQAEDGMRDYKVTRVQTCALPICGACWKAAVATRWGWTARTTEPIRHAFGARLSAVAQSPRPGSVHHGADVGLRRRGGDGATGVQDEAAGRRTER